MGRMKQMDIKLLIVGCQLFYSIYKLTLIIISTVKWYCIRLCKAGNYINYGIYNMYMLVLLS